MNYYFLIVISSLFSVSQSTLTKMASDAKKVISFNFIKFFGACLFFALISLGTFKFHIPTLFYAIFGGITLVLSTVFGHLALTKGPMAVTSLICSYNIVIPCIFGIAYLKESLTYLKAMGFILLIISMYLLSKRDSERAYKKGWIYCVIITFLCNGLSSIIQKLHQTNFKGQFLNEFIFFVLLSAFILLFVLTLFKREKPNVKNIKFAVPSGILLGVANFLTLFLSARVDASVLFPIVTIFTVIFVSLTSRFVFKDKLTLKQIFGIALGVISVIIIK